MHVTAVLAKRKNTYFPLEVYVLSQYRLVVIAVAQLRYICLRLSRVTSPTVDIIMYIIG